MSQADHRQALGQVTCLLQVSLVLSVLPWGWYQRLNKIDTHVSCPKVHTLGGRTGSRDRKEAILAPRSRYYKINPGLFGEPGESWAEEIFQFIKVDTWKLLKGGTCGLLPLQVIALVSLFLPPYSEVFCMGNHSIVPHVQGWP